MPKVLSISSQVVHGHVGNSAAAFVLQRMGHEVMSLPTVLLSNRPGYRAIAGERIAPESLNALLEAALQNGWLADVDAIMSGYLPTAEHASFCASWILTIKGLSPNVIYLCDPILGDEPQGLYIDAAAAAAIKEKLVPLADILTPNRFELAWLSGRTVPSITAALEAARSLDRPAVLVTSGPAGTPDKLADILVEGATAVATASAHATVHAHGTGDFFAAIFLAHRLKGLPGSVALQAATAAIGLVLEASQGRSELGLIETQARWAADPPPLAPLVDLSSARDPA